MCRNVRTETSFLLYLWKLLEIKAPHLDLKASETQFGEKKRNSTQQLINRLGRTRSWAQILFCPSVKSELNKMATKFKSERVCVWGGGLSLEKTLDKEDWQAALLLSEKPALNPFLRAKTEGHMV